MQFIGRAAEKQRILRELEDDSQSAVLVYGRRRVGKSELIKHCLSESGTRSIYYECKQTSEANNVQSLAAVASEALGFPRLAFSDIEELLSFLFEQSRRQKLIVVLDEYPYLRDAVPGMDSILQSLIDANTVSSSCKLILCGSFIDIMKSLLEEHNPLYGRISLQVDLKPMDYFDSAQFYPDFSNEDKVRLYSVFGGIPHYNRLVNPSMSAQENIIRLVTAPDARLQSEVPAYLHAELSKVANANEAFEAMAAGAVKFSDILSQSHVSSSPALADALGKLVRMELVDKAAPMNDQTNKRRIQYRICDRLSAFYYRYVFRYSSQLQVMSPDAFFDRFVAADFEEQFVPHAFEEVCKQYLLRLNRGGRMEPPFELIGRYCYDDPVAKQNGEFDVVTKDERGHICYEAKFRSAPLTRQLVDEERRQVESSPLNCYAYGFFSQSGFACSPQEDERFITLDELYAG